VYKEIVLMASTNRQEVLSVLHHITGSSASSLRRSFALNTTIADNFSWGSVTREGLKIYSISNDTLGFYSRSITDLQLLAKVFQLADDIPPSIPPKPISKCRFAYIKTEQWDRASVDAPRVAGSGASSELTRAWEMSKTLLRTIGAEVVDVDLPFEFDHIAGRRHRYIMNGEARVNFLPQYVIGRDQLDPFLVQQVENTSRISRRMQLDAYDQLATLRPVIDRLASQYDAIITPSVPGEAPMGLGYTGDPRFCAMWTILHVPCVNIPGFASESGMPIGLTLVAPR